VQKTLHGSLVHPSSRSFLHELSTVAQALKLCWRSFLHECVIISALVRSGRAWVHCRDEVLLVVYCSINNFPYKELKISVRKGYAGWHMRAWCSWPVTCWAGMDCSLVGTGKRLEWTPLKKKNRERERGMDC